METLDWLREPEHTGENRCWPCTVVNIALVGVLVLWLLVRNRRLASLTVAAIGAGLIYVRGYFVPYTPTFAPQLVAASPLPDSLFHDDRYEPKPEERQSLVETDHDGEAILGELAGAGVIEADAEMIRLSEDVETAWHEEMERLSTLSVENLAAEIERSVPEIAETGLVEVDGEEWVILGENDAFMSQQVAIPELAAYRALEPYLDDEDARLAGARTFRMFLENCPVCGSEIVEATESNCCGAYASPDDLKDILVCPECEERVFAFPNDDDEVA
ncbi:MAG: hypothetical protein ABEI57_05850 [Halapricum sp.]